MHQTTEWVKEFWEQPSWIFEDDRMLRERTLSYHHSLWDAVLPSFPAEDHPRVRSLLTNEFVNSVHMRPWRNIVWTPVYSEDRTIVDLRTTLDPERHPYLPTLIAWLRDHPSTTPEPPRLPRPRVADGDLPPAFRGIGRSHVSVRMRDVRLAALIEEVYRRSHVPESERVTTFPLPTELVTQIHPERLLYYQWLCRQRGNPWLTYEEIVTVFHWDHNPVHGLVHHMDLVTRMVARLNNTYRFNVPQRWHRPLGATRVYDTTKVAEDLRLAAVFVASTGVLALRVSRCPRWSRTDSTWVASSKS